MNIHIQDTILSTFDPGDNVHIDGNDIHGVVESITVDENRHVSYTVRWWSSGTCHSRMFAQGAVVSV